MDHSARWNRAAFASLGALVAVRLVAGFQFHSAAVVAPLLVASLGLSYTEAGTLIGAYVLPAVLLSIPGGLLIQRFGDRRVLLAALVLAATGGALAAAASAFATLFAGRVLAGTGGALLQIIVLKMATERFTGDRMATATATVLASWPLGIALALVVLGAVAQRAGWRAALALAALYPVLALAIAWRAAAVFPESAAPPGARPRDFAGGQLRGMLPAVGISVSWLLFNAGFSGFVAFAPTWLADLGRGLDRAGAAASLTGWALVAAQPWGGWLADRLGRPSLVLSGGALVAAAAIWGTLATDGAPALYVVTGLALGLGPGVMGAALARSARIEQRALAFGVFATGSGAGSMLGPGLAGAASDLFGAPSAGIVLAGALIVVALGPWMWAVRAGRRLQAAASGA